ncbi:hypothetical protein AGMMS49992_28420 [Clostridia bacterium]|nr:hypothetical protein AGMMS49992_28420 [Clostridia bacterium]
MDDINITGNHAERDIVVTILETPSDSDTFESIIDRLKPISSIKSPNPMHYLAEGIGFYGREEEVRWLSEFCLADEKVLYAVVHGIGGVGKSKLLFEYIKQHTSAEWYMCFLTETMITSLLSFNDYSYPQNLLIAIDYASRQSDIIGKWLTKISTMDVLSNKLRVVLIERQGQNRESMLGVFSPWLEKLYGNTTQRRQLKQIEFGFLELKQITADCLGSLINDYIIANYPDKRISFNEVEKIIEYASKGLALDENRQSPLVVLLITDAYVSGQDFRKWNLALLVQNYVERLTENWLVSLCDNDIALYKSLLKLLVFATAVDGFSINDEIPNMYSSDIIRLTENQLCKRIIDGATGFANEIIHAIEPDIVGEFIVLNYLDHLVVHRAKLELVESFYSRPLAFSDFIARCIDEFADMSVFESFLTILLIC